MNRTESMIAVANMLKFRALQDRVRELRYRGFSYRQIKVIINKKEGERHE